MFYPAELVLKNYIPDSIESGMFFIIKTSSGENVSPIQLCQVEKSNVLINNLSLSQLLEQKLDYPVHLFIIDPIDHSILASQEQIGWFDEGEESDEYRDITLKDINNILENEGLIEIEIDEKDDIVNVILEEGKIIIRVV